MNVRLQQFLAAENVSQAQFADIIGVARASVSHVLAGRNKPGYDFLTSTIAHYPNLNLEWLITGKGKMYRNSHEDDDLLFRDDPAMTPIIPEERECEISDDLPVDTEIPESAKTRKAVKVIIFYDDNTFQEIKQ